MKKYGVIMAGGGGTRFWPLSRQKTPKQLLNLTGNDLMINETLDRISGCIPYDDIFIITNKMQGNAMLNAVQGKVAKERILLEPSSRNTAACIGYSAIEILSKYGDGIMCVFPADHYIEKKEEFVRILNTAIAEAEKGDNLLTIGVTPSFAATGYGYIKYAKSENAVSCKVEEFVEKPNYTLAKEYLENGNYLWNSGMFVWKASVILKEIERYLPEVFECLMKIKRVLGKKNEQELVNEIYPKIPQISIDYGILERSDKVLVLPGDFGWNDVGSWDMLEKVRPKDQYGNVVVGNVINVATENSVVYSTDKLVATVGLDNIVVVQTPDAILVCDKNNAQQVKKVVDELQKAGKNQFL